MSQKIYQKFAKPQQILTADPSIYNEYTDGRKLSLGEDNFAAGQELTRWLVQKTAGK